MAHRHTSESGISNGSLDLTNVVHDGVGRGTGILFVENASRADAVKILRANRDASDLASEAGPVSGDG